MRGMRRSWSHSTPGRIAAAITSPRKKSENSTRSFQNASASTTMPITTRVATAAFCAIPLIAGLFPPEGSTKTAGRRARPHGEAARVREKQRERIHLDSRRHGIVLVPALLRAFLLAGIGGLVVTLAWPLPAVGAALVILAAVLGLRAVWRWDRTHVIITDDQLALVRGTLRRRTAAVRLERVGAVEVDQGLLGRLLGYGTLIAGPLEIKYVPQPRNVYRVVESLSH